MPSRREPCGLVFLEAMANGLPCIGVRRDAMPEIIESGVTGFLLDSDSELDLVSRFEYLLEHPLEGAHMGLRGHATVLDRFLWRHVADRMTSSLTALQGVGPR